MHSVCWRQQDVLHWKPERCLMTVTKGRVTPASQRQTYWHENFHFALFSHHTCYFQIVECNFKIIHLFWLPVEWSFAHRWLKNWVASPWADPKKNYFFFFFESWGGKSATFVPCSPLPPFCWSPLDDSEIQTLLSRRPSFRSAGAILVSRDEASAFPRKPAAVLGPRTRGGCRGRRLSAGTTTIAAEASAPRLKPTGMDLGPRSGTS